MADIALLDSWGNSFNAALSYNPSSGDDRGVAGFIYVEHDAAITIDSVTHGDQTAGLKDQETSPDEDPTSYWVITRPFYLTEAQTAARSGNNITPAFSATPDYYAVHAVSFENWNQAVPLAASDSDEDPPDPATLSVAITGYAGGLVLGGYITGGGAGDPFAWTSPLTKRVEDVQSSTTFTAADHTPSSAGSVTVECTNDSGTGNRIAIHALSFSPYGAAAGRGLRRGLQRGTQRALHRMKLENGLWRPLFPGRVSLAGAF